jgi:hypothetical protein
MESQLVFTVLVIALAAGYLGYLSLRKLFRWKTGTCGGCSASQPASPLITTLTVKPRLK